IIHGNILCPAGDILKVGTAGRLVSQKGIDIFIRAAGRIVYRYDRVCFYIAGEGPERGRLEFLRDLLGLQEKVFFLGDVKQMRSFLKDLDIFVLASRSEGLSIALLEAGCAGLPLIASATGGIPEIVRDGETGILVPAEDELLLAEAIIFLLEDSEKEEKPWR
ncbi:MAG: glycosyltransferase, partial [Dethiobacteria bacterium]